MHDDDVTRRIRKPRTVVTCDCGTLIHTVAKTAFFETFTHDIALPVAKFKKSYAATCGGRHVVKIAA